VFRAAWHQRQSFLTGPVYSDRRDQPELLRHQQGSPGCTAQCIVASHMEAVNHGMLSRKELREFLEEKGMTPRVLVPEDGETLRF
jgi:hypothetical protein